MVPRALSPNSLASLSTIFSLKFWSLFFSIIINFNNFIWEHDHHTLPKRFLSMTIEETELMDNAEADAAKELHVWHAQPVGAGGAATWATNENAAAKRLFHQW